MTSTTTTSSLGALVPSLETAWQDVDSSFERFCLTAGIGAIEGQDKHWVERCSIHDLLQPARR